MTAIVPEQFANLSQTTLSAAIADSVTTSISVNSASTFPSSAQYRILIDNELMLVTGGAGTTTWTVTRGVESTTAAPHASGSQVSHIVTAGGIGNFRSNNAVVDTYANEPAAGRAGALFIPSNSLYVQHDNGSSFDTFALLYGGMTVPVSSNFAWQNQGSATVSTTNGYTYFVAPGTGAAHVTGRNIAAPSTPYHAIFAWSWQVMSQTINDGDYRVGPYWTDGTGIVSVNHRLGASGGGSVMDISKWNTTTSFAAHYFYTAAFYPLPVIWCRIGDDGSGSSSARTVDFSVDGVNWQNAWSSSRTDFITPTKIGFQIAFNVAPSTTNVTVAWLHYSTTS